MSSDAGIRTIVLGAGGMLGRQWSDALSEAIGRGEAAALDRAACDILAPGSLDAAIPKGAEVVINCAAYTNVDGAESEEDIAFAINGFAVGEIAGRCREVGALLVHYSTDYVFPGDAQAPYPIDAPRKALGSYGRSKALGEELVEASGADFLTLRSSWLYAAHGNNFVRTILRLAGERESLRVVDDQRGRPTSVPMLVETTQRLLGAGARGTLHATDGGECTWFEFASEIVRVAGLPCRVEPCTSEEFPRPAPRPAYSVLDLTATERLIGPLRDWREALADVVTKVQAGTGNHG
jgi:dTDP-4-dehydrorhamnose reductase